LPPTTSSQEMEWAYSYNPGARHRVVRIWRLL